MTCWVCIRQARGFGHADTRRGVGDPRRFCPDWVFCSRRCLDAFHATFQAWLRLQDICNPAPEVAMVDPSDTELAAMRRCLKPFGEVAAEIGFDKPLGDYTEAQALRVVDAIVTRYTEAMVEHHEATRHLPGRDPSAPRTDVPWEVWP